MAKDLRKVHVDEEIWKYYLKRGQRGDIVIFAPHGQRYEIDLRVFLSFQGVQDVDYAFEHFHYKILPSDIKRYIIERIKEC